METHSHSWQARAAISATGTWWRPFIPSVRGQGVFEGRQIHTVDYRSPKADDGGRRDEEGRDQ